MADNARIAAALSYWTENNPSGRLVSAMEDGRDVVILGISGGNVPARATAADIRRAAITYRIYAADLDGMIGDVDPVDAALGRWAAGSLAARAAVEIALRTTIRDYLIPDFVIEFAPGVARLDPAFMEEENRARLSSSGEVLVDVVASLLGLYGLYPGPGIASGPARVDLRGLYRLDARNLAVVVEALAFRE